MGRVIEAVYRNGALHPLEKPNSPEGARVKLRIEGIYGILKDWKIDPQKLKDELRTSHG